MLGDGGQEVGGGEDLEVAVNLGIEAGAVDDDVGGPFQASAPWLLRLARCQQGRSKGGWDRPKTEIRPVK